MTAPVTARADRRDRRGSILLVSLGILAVLSVFALSFASIVRLESRAATNVTDGVRARLAAEAGVERALYLLTRSELADPITSFHAPWTYRSQDARTWGIGLPLEAALNPSYRAGGTPEGLAYSGVVSGTYRAGGDHFALKVVPASARLSLNGQQPRATFIRMLNTLGEAILDFDTARTSADPAEPLRDAGWAAHVAAQRAELEARGVAPGVARTRTAPRDPIVARAGQLYDLRTSLGGRFQSLDQLRAVLSEEDLERLRDHVTVDAWLDPAMVGFDASGNEVTEWRAPVDVNTATWPVLVAVFQGLRARRPVHPSEAATEVTSTQARALATAIDLRRRGPPGEPFRGWADFTRFLDACGVALTLTQRAAIVANADPNLIHWPRNPDATINPGLGKADLDYATTELCFIAYGVYEVSALGRVLDPAGVLVAQHTVHVVAQVYDTLRLLTQADFEAARTSTEVEKTASFPNPVRAVTGSFRVRTGADGQDEVVFEPLTDADERRRLRVQASSRTSGWVQLIADEPTVPRAAENFAGGRFQEAGGSTMGHHEHLFRFGPDLRGELWKFTPGNAAGVPPEFEETIILPDGSTFIRYWIERVRQGGQPVFHEPLREGSAPFLVDRVQAFTLAAGAPPAVLGLRSPADDARIAALQALAATLFPPGGRVEYGEDLVPDGLLVHPDRATDLRYDGSLLSNNSGLLLWFKLNLSTLETWTPLFESWTQVGGHPWVGYWYRPNGPNTCKFQVEARLIHGRGAQAGKFTLELRSRRWTEDAAGRLVPLEIWDPADPIHAFNPEAEDFNQPYYSRHVRLELDAARAGEWHMLYVPVYGNVHMTYVDGQAAEIVQLVVTDDPGAAVAAWPLPDWPAELKGRRDAAANTWEGRAAPGGFVYPGRQQAPFATATLDELLTTDYQRTLVPPPKTDPDNPDAAPAIFYRRMDVRQLPQLPPDVGVNVSTRRYVPWGPDHCGSFQADLPAFDADRVKVGRLVWNQLDPRRWGLKAYDGGDFPSQSAYRYSTEAPRDHLHGQALPRPPMAMMSDDYARHWRLVYLGERRALLQELEQRYASMLAGAPPAAAATFQAYIDTFAAERADLDAEEQAILAQWGPPQPPPDAAEAGASLAFNAAAQVIPGLQQTVRLRIDFLYFDRAQQTAQPPIGRDGQEWYAASVLNVSPILDDVIVPYQERPRVVRRWDE